MQNNDGIPDKRPGDNFSRLYFRVHKDTETISTHFLFVLYWWWIKLSHCVEWYLVQGVRLRASFHFQIPLAVGLLIFPLHVRVQRIAGVTEYSVSPLDERGWKEELVLSRAYHVAGLLQ